jgi:predicted transcriptional regulator
LASTAKRGRIEILADILEVVKRQSNCRLIRVSYGANLPLDRAKKLLAQLSTSGLVAIRKEESVTTYQITARGLEFLDVHRKMLGFLEALREE